MDAQSRPPFAPGPLVDSAGLDRAADSLVDRGWWRGAGAISDAWVASLGADLADLVEQDRLHRAGIGRDRDFQVDGTVRRDWIYWMHPRRPAQAAFLEACEDLRVELNRRLFLGLFEFEAHLALYPPGGFYKRHFDSFRGAASRTVSLVAYLNRGWREGDGGELVLYPVAGDDRVRVQPRAGTLVLFMSEEVEHEVLPARIERGSVAGWFRVNNTTAAAVDPPR
jgi:SM-20-related protein